jgi:acetoin utilization deacetylase AcuC-like enzyme
MPANADSPILVLRADECLEHDPGPGHPEAPERLRAVHASLDAEPIVGTATRGPRRATHAELARVHAVEHVDRVARTASKSWTQFDPDTAAGRRSYEAALLSAGAVMDATESVVEGGARGAFALVRPPGHHALGDSPMGFCLFNNVAVAAEHAIRELGCKRALVLDIDVHHGNGTQDTFYRRSDVLYVSSHRFPFYPGTGSMDEIGAGPGEGFTVNMPLPAGLGDADFVHLYRSVVEPIVDEHEPDLILVSAGYDTWKGDPLGGGMTMTGDGYRALAALFAGWAARHCAGRIVFALEGGYDPAGVVAGVRETLDVLTGATPRGASEMDEAPSRDALSIGESVRRNLAPSWRSLAN